MKNNEDIIMQYNQHTIKPVLLLNEPQNFQAGKIYSLSDKLQPVQFVVDALQSESSQENKI